MSSLFSDQLIEKIRRGWIPAHIYNDRSIFEIERERIFGSSWQLLAHASEVPDPGDYVVRRVVDDSFIVVRGEDGAIRVLFNMCLHRGMQLCRAEMGNASHFRCPYHGWTYRSDGRLTGVPFQNEAYGGNDGLSREDHNLLPPAATEIINGMVFVSLDPKAEPLAQYLGGALDYLAFYTAPSPEGVEIPAQAPRGPPGWNSFLTARFQ